MTQTMTQKQNILGTAPVGGLIRKFAIPSIISMLVTAAYNITDQIFIGNVVGMLGYAATNVAFPSVTFTMAFAQLVGIGTAAGFNKYRGVITNGNGSIFNQIYDPKGLNLEGNCITSDYYAYLAGIRQFANPEAIDINVFATPGIDYVNNTLLSQEAVSMIEEERGDAIYVMTTPDRPFGIKDSILYPDEVVSNLEDSDIDSSYAATYYPWVKYFDADNKKYIMLPPTKDVVRAMAYTDNTSYPWFAPAGIIRGGVECDSAQFITKLEDEDVLYDGRINPIKTFSVDGVKIWGQKTLYSEDTPLNRINVRRLMLRLKKLVIGASRRLIFEQNDATLKSQFESLVKPILDDIKSKRGIYDYRLEIQDSPEARDMLMLPVVLHVKPTKALEYISINFVISPESTRFEE